MITCALTKDGRVLAGSVEMATRLRDRMRGLLWRDGLTAGAAMLIRPCGSIHTFGMRFALDVFFLDRANTVVRAVRNVPPGRMVFGGWRAAAVLEIQAGWLPAEALREGDRVEMGGATSA